MSAVPAQSLYSREILRLATSLPYGEQIEPIHASATRRAPVCGSEMSVDVALDGGRIAAIAIRARACALGQASASVLRSEAIGQSLADIRAVRDGLQQQLLGKADAVAIWPELDALAYARDYPARHGAILLPFDTLLAALEGDES
jgi:NifU-like protein involved in Fe-S cluster formation